MSFLTPQHVYRKELEILLAEGIDMTLEAMANGHLESHAEYKYLAGKIAGLRLAQEYLLDAEKICAEKYL